MVQTALQKGSDIVVIIMVDVDLVAIQSRIPCQRSRLCCMICIFSRCETVSAPGARWVQECNFRLGGSLQLPFWSDPVGWQPALLRVIEAQSLASNLS